MIYGEWLPNAISIGVPYKLFFHLSPKKLKAFDRAYVLGEKRKDKEMLMQATYFYEALGTVMSNAFGKSRVKWRTRTYSEEFEENNLSGESMIAEKRRRHALEMDTMRRNFLLEKKRREAEEQGESE